MYMSMHVHILMYIFIDVCTCIHLYINMHVCVYNICMYICMYGIYGGVPPFAGVSARFLPSASPAPASETRNAVLMPLSVAWPCWELGPAGAVEQGCSTPLAQGRSERSPFL